MIVNLLRTREITPPKTAEDIYIERAFGSEYINSTTSYIGSYAFAQCVNLQSVNFPNCSMIDKCAFYHAGNIQYLSFPNVDIIGTQAFLSCGLVSVPVACFPNCIEISSYAFSSCHMLQSIAFSQCISIGSSAFAACYSLTDVYLPKCQYVQAGAFRYCSKLQQIELPDCTYMSWEALYNCNDLRGVSLPKLSTWYRVVNGASLLSYICAPACTYVSQTFEGCTALKSVILPACISIDYAFVSCSLEYISLPQCESLLYSAFMNTLVLSSIVLPRCHYLGASVFMKCSDLGVVYIGNPPKSGNLMYRNIISTQAFQSCCNLLSLYILDGSAPMTLSNINAFASTPISDYTASTGGVYGSIFVPASLYSDYIAATNWVTYSDRIVSLTDAEILNIRGSWVNSLSATLVYPQSSPLYNNNNSINLCLSSITATYFNGTSLSVDKNDCIVTDTTAWGGQTFNVRYDTGVTSITAVLIPEINLPDGYTRVGYIESSSTDLPYIDTEIYPTNSDRWKIVVQCNSTSNSGTDYIIYAHNCGIDRVAQRLCFMAQGTEKTSLYIKEYGSTGNNIPINTLDLFISYPNSVMYYYNTAYTASGSNLDYTYLIFAKNNAGTPTRSMYDKLRIWYIEIPNRLQLVPCIRNSDGVVGMYDLMGNICSLTNTPFFINAGTGSFTYGYNP